MITQDSYCPSYPESGVAKFEESESVRSSSKTNLKIYHQQYFVFFQHTLPVLKYVMQRYPFNMSRRRYIEIPIAVIKWDRNNPPKAKRGGSHHQSSWEKLEINSKPIAVNTSCGSSCF